MSVHRLIVDTNTLVRFFCGEPVEQAEKARSLLERADAGEVELVILPLVIAETFFTLESFYKMNRVKIAETLSDFLDSRGLDVIEKGLLSDTLKRCREHKAHFVDAYLAAVALETGEGVASFDRDFDAFAGVKRIEPG